MVTEFDLQAAVRSTTTQKRILVVDDEERLHTLIQSYLNQEGFDVVTAHDGREAIYMARQQNPDLIILDLMMPEMDGLSFMHALSKKSRTPVIILSAKSDEREKISVLELGADDYVVKLFSLRELTARVRAVLRRVGQLPPAPEQLRAADVILDRATRLVQVGGQRVELTPSEFDLLAVLMANPGSAFTRDELLDRVQGMAYEGYIRTIDVHVRNLRAKIEADSRHPRYIETVFGIGYRFATA